MKVDIDKIRRSVGIIGESNHTIEILNLIGQVANTDISVLVNGESGSGKDIIAKAIHKNSKRKFENLIIVNCAAIPSGIIESELFGHKKGSFTGAIDNRKGYFEAANKGTIFLDEIGELPIETQAKLLRVIEDGEFIRVGENKSQKVDTRIIAATNKNLLEEVNNNKFRQDLYFRLKTITINATPLREKSSDIHLFVERFGLEFCAKNDIAFKGFTSDAIKSMQLYSWPGNIRELKNVVEGLLVMHKGSRINDEMVQKHLDLQGYRFDSNLPVFVSNDTEKAERELVLKQLLYIRQDINEIKQIIVGKDAQQDGSFKPANSALFLPAKSDEANNVVLDGRTNIEDATPQAIQKDAVGSLTMEEIEYEMISKTLEKFKGNRRKTAVALNISERTLYRKIKDYGIQRKNK